ncbi:hypothetical protein ABBQ32_005869 [Trebouxia sp. C0010 RCD-2024]
MLHLALPLFALVASGGAFTLVEAANVETSFLPASGVPDATALFPLTAQTSAGETIVSSGGQRTFTGVVNNTARWVADEDFGFVLECVADQQNSIILDPIPIGMQSVDLCHVLPKLTGACSRTQPVTQPHLCTCNSGHEGPFAVNLWFKANASANNGNEYSYLLSAIAYTTPNVSAGNNTYIPNSLQLMLPQALNDRSGLVRAIVEDSNDPNLIAYTLDSDGKHNVNATKTSDPDFKNVSDGTWHMVTITTHTDRTRGFLLYVDGQMAGQLPDSTSGDTSTPYGGDPIFLTGNMYLCARADGDPSRYLSGSVAQASFYNEALNASSITALYSSVNASMVSKPGAAEAELEGGATVSNVTTVKGTSCVFPFTYQDAAYTTCMAPQGSGSRYCRDTNGAFLICATQSSEAVSAIPTGSSPVSSPVIAGGLPALTATPGGTNLDQSSPAGQGQGLSQGAIAGIVLGSVAAAALITTLIAVIVIKTKGPGRHKRLQEAPSSKFLVHNSALDRQVELAKAADAKEAQNDLFHGPESSSDFHIRASS